MSQENPTITWDVFSEQVADLYKNLYDLVYLQTHPASDALISDQGASGRDKGWRVHNLLLDAIEALDPGQKAPAFSPPWRRYHLMLSRFVDGISPDDVAEELAISRRQFFREQREALERTAQILWRRHVESDEGAEQPTPPETGEPSDVERLELLRREAARVKKRNRYARIEKVAEGVVSIVHEIMEKRSLRLEISMPDALPVVAVDPSILRQIVLSALGWLSEATQENVVRLAAHVERPDVKLSIALDQEIPLSPETERELGARMSALEEMAALSQAEISALKADGRLDSFEIVLPVAQRTVLVVDDNQDILELFRRYLESSHYRVIVTDQADDALRIAEELRPDVIILDLMMSERDGWDILQTLLHQPETRHIPVVVCSVLKQKSLALSLGATAFLEKPISKQELVTVIQALD